MGGDATVMEAVSAAAACNGGHKACNAEGTSSFAGASWPWLQPDIAWPSIAADTDVAASTADDAAADSDPQRRRY